MIWISFSVLTTKSRELQKFFAEILRDPYISIKEKKKMCYFIISFFPFWMFFLVHLNSLPFHLLNIVVSSNVAYTMKI